MTAVPRWRLVLALLTGPVMASLTLLANYVVLYPAQAADVRWPFWIACAVSAVVVAAAVVWDVAAYRRIGEGAEGDKYLAVLGGVLNAFFVLLIVNYAIPTFILHATD